MAPEFYRRVYKRNPKKHFKTITSIDNISNNISNTVWMDAYLTKEKENGINKITR